MKLCDFMEETGITVTTLAKRCGLGWHQIWKIKKGVMPKLTTALRIQIYTNGRVAAEDLISKEDLKEIYDNFNKPTRKEEKNQDL